MGGRGTSSFSGGGGRGQASKQKWTKGIGTKVADTLKEALGAKGAPIPLSEAYLGANPLFDKTGSYAEYTHNCQRCVVTYELRRRGYDVVTNPTYNGDKWPRVSAWQQKGFGTGFNTRDNWTGFFRHAKVDNVGASMNKTVEKNINDKMKQYGNGARAVVGVNWQRGGGHVFNVENVNGNIVAVDAQTGRRSSLSKALSGSVPSSTQLTRTDNLRISERAKEAVTTRRY